MNRLKFLKLIFLFMFFLNSCGTVKEGFQNPKKNNSDEFLVEKKSPLVMPPEFEELPIPNQNEKQEDISQSSLQDLFSDDRQENDDVMSNKKLEETLLDKIKTN
tara:strand:- start:377 stop:688 length:312 start_codon:yes stop_codon:yes gene_type:complete